MKTMILRMLCALLLLGVASCTERPRSKPSDGGPTDAPDAFVRDLVVPDLDPQEPICQPATCSGCCLDGYRCLKGTSQQACGQLGQQCAPCTAPESCVGGVCMEGALEICNGADDDGDGDEDEGCDDDLDGYCDASMQVEGTPGICSRGNDDCDDDRPRVNPDAPEICNDLDDNCDGQSDETGCAPITDVVPSRPAHLPAVVREHGCASAVDGKIYCLGGMTHLLDISDRIVSFDPSDDSVSVLPTRLPMPRSQLACVNSTSQNKIYCFGGFVQRHICAASTDAGCVESTVDAYLFDEILEYDPQSGRVVVKGAKLPAASGRMACAEHGADGKIYCFGGQLVSGENSDQIFAYDPASDQLLEKSAKLPSLRRALSCASAGAEIFCFGGEHADVHLDSIIKYTPGSDSVSELSQKLPLALSRLACTTTGDGLRVLCVGGRGKAGTEPLLYDEAVPQVIEFTPATSAATLLSLHLAQARDSHACALHGPSGAIFCLGGSHNDLFYDEIVAITP